MYNRLRHLKSFYSLPPIANHVGSNYFQNIPLGQPPGLTSFAPLLTSFWRSKLSMTGYEVSLCYMKTSYFSDGSSPRTSGDVTLIVRDAGASVRQAGEYFPYETKRELTIRLCSLPRGGVLRVDCRCTERKLTDLDVVPNGASAISGLRQAPGPVAQ
jgi:hypothetical protein